MNGWKFRSSKTGRTFRVWRNGRNKWSAIYYSWARDEQPIFFGETRRELFDDIEQWEGLAILVNATLPPQPPSVSL